MSSGAKIEGVVPAPIDKVWATFRPFGPETMNWWPIYQWLALEPPGKDEVGAVRSFKTFKGLEYKERLELRDDQKYIMKHSLVEMKPNIPSLKNIITTVQMSAKSDTETIINWSTEIEADQATTEQIISVHQKTYTEAIQSLAEEMEPKQNLNFIYELLEDLKKHISQVTQQQAIAQAQTIPQLIQQKATDKLQGISQLIQQQATDRTQKYEYLKYPRRKDTPDLPLEEFPPMVKGLPPGRELPPKKLGFLIERLIEYVYSEINFSRRLEKIQQSGDDPWTAYYAGWIQAPTKIPQTWKDDVEFCRQLIQGVNPMVITLCTNEGVIPQEMRHLTAQGKSIPELIAEKRLFILDYGDLEDIPQVQGKVFYAPYVLVYRELLEDGKSRLNLLGIQLTRYQDRKNEVYTPNYPYPNKYLLAKIHAASADSQYHQFTFHLGLTHLAVEPFVMSHHNCFPSSHPIGQLLKPHFQDTIGINFLARQTLVAKDKPFTDRTFSAGTTGGLRLIFKEWKKWDFFGMSFPQQLLSRGFDEEGSDGVEDFFFRDDGFKIWNALIEYISNVVAAVYKDDAAVAADPVIQTWAQETADPERGAVPGFPEKIETQELLVNTLTNIIFLASAQHSAINFSQCQNLTYVPNRPNVLFRGVPETEGDITMEYVFGALQSLTNAHFQVFFSNLLSSPSLHPLSDLPLENDLFPDIHAVFMAKLNLIALEIEVRNKKLEQEGKVPYPYLSPKQIASSIDT